MEILHRVLSFLSNVAVRLLRFLSCLHGTTLGFIYRGTEQEGQGVFQDGFTLV